MLHFYDAFFTIYIWYVYRILLFQGKSVYLVLLEVSTATKMDKAQGLLEEFGLRKTGCRLEVLQQFLGHDFALSHADLEKALGNSYDRVTIYRTLYSFEEKGLIHSINDVSGAGKFALCKNDSCSEHRHQDNHIHFTCRSCSQTYCLNDVDIPQLTLPQGYMADRLHFSAEGTCIGCSQVSST